MSRFRTSCPARPIAIRLITSHEHARTKFRPTAVEHEFPSGFVTALLNTNPYRHKSYVNPTIARKYSKPLHGPTNTVRMADGHMQQPEQCTTDNQLKQGRRPTPNRPAHSTRPAPPPSTTRAAERPPPRPLMQTPVPAPRTKPAPPMNAAINPPPTPTTHNTLPHRQRPEHHRRWRFGGGV